jgi:MYXO-CTERM domain-containing protein
MSTRLFARVLVVAGLCLTSAHAAIVNFSYTQTDAATGSGTIAPFTLMGHDFTATPLPAATVFNPNPGLTPSGFVGAINGMAGNANELNQAIGLLFSGTVIATATDGYTVEIALRFVAKQTQVPDVSDYTWNVSYGDSSPTVDTVSSSMRFAMYFSRDDIIDSVETPNTFQRYTQNNQTFVAGQDSFVNTDTTTAPIKDASDAGAPTGTDAEGRDLAFYFGWRDQGALTQGAVLVDNFAVNGFLAANDATLVPEPSGILLGALGLAALFFWRRRSSSSL